MKVSHDVITRPFDFVRDRAELLAIISEAKGPMLDLLGAAVSDGHALILVAELGGHVVGWTALRTSYRTDTGWSPDGNTADFVAGDNAYLEYLEVALLMRGRGVATRLLDATERGALAAGRNRLWLHTSEANADAQRLYEREGWKHVDTIHPTWKDQRATRVYAKDLTPDGPAPRPTSSARGGERGSPQP